MLCPQCPQRATCQSACDLLKSELARIEKPLTESLRSPQQLERLAGKTAATEFFRESQSAEEEIEAQEEEAESLQKYRELYQSFENLTPKQMACVKLAYWELMTHEEIGVVLGISRQAVEFHLKQSYRKMRNYLSGSLKSTCVPALYK